MTNVTQVSSREAATMLRVAGYEAPPDTPIGEKILKLLGAFAQTATRLDQAFPDYQSTDEEHTLSVLDFLMTQKPDEIPKVIGVTEITYPDGTKQYGGLACLDMRTFHWFKPPKDANNSLVGSPLQITDVCFPNCDRHGVLNPELDGDESADDRLFITDVATRIMFQIIEKWRGTSTTTIIIPHDMLGGREPDYKHMISRILILLADYLEENEQVIVDGSLDPLKTFGKHTYTDYRLDSQKFLKACKSYFATDPYKDAATIKE
ncbi:hypothetical protein KC945_02415 [Candidatus Saccharibacteria bacterium]|nr:hypothetical protein [Candidatus Saccharibacteria bacterium]